MKYRLDPQTTPEEKFHNFEDALGKIVQVSKDELQQRIEADKQARSGKPKRGRKPTSVSALASGDKG